MNQSRINSSSLGILIYLIHFLIAGILLFGFSAFGYLKSQNKSLQIILELKENVEFESIDQLVSELKQNNKINPNSVKYISRSEGLKWLSEQSETELLDQDLPNPLSDIIIISRTGNFQNTEDLKILETELKENKWVSKVILPDSENRQFIKYQNITQYLTIGFFLILLIILFLILKIYFKFGYKISEFREQEMNLVGGSYYTSFRKNVISQVFWSNLMIISICIFIYSYFYQNNSEWINYFNWTYLIIVNVAIFVGSMLVTYLATIFKKTN